MYMMVRYLLENTETDILITVPTTSLVEQLYKDFEDYSVDWSAEENCQMIYSGKEKNPPKMVKLTLADDSEIRLLGNQLIKLNTGEDKRMQDLTDGDEIDDRWLEEYRKKQVS